MEKDKTNRRQHFEKVVNLIENTLQYDNLQFIEDVMDEVMRRFKTDYELFKRDSQFKVFIEDPDVSLSSQHPDQ